MRNLAPKLDPRTWWLGAVLIAASAGVVSDLGWQLAGFGLLAFAISLVARVSTGSRGLAFYLLLAIAIVTLRVVFRIVFNGGSVLDSPTLLELPFLSVVGPFGELRLLGPLAAATLTAALTDGLRLANIVLAFGLANLAANPRRLLRHAPGLIYELASTAAVALNLAPELISSVSRVRKARQIRGLSNGLGSLGQLAVPVLEQTMDRALGLAASMEARGFGRSGALAKSRVTSTRLLFLVALVAAATSSYLLLATATHPLLSAAPLIFSAVALLAVFRITNRSQLRTALQQPRLRGADWLVLAACLLLLLLALAGIGEVSQSLGGA